MISINPKRESRIKSANYSLEIDENEIDVCETGFRSMANHR